ncbi:hypothetical protein EXE42_15670, partial [Halorubrum sp. SP3]
MSDNVSEPWWPDDIRLVTDTDLQAKRYARGQLSDPTDYSARLVETVRRAEGLQTASAAIDRALRIQLAHLIDSRDVLFSRDDYDVSYLIPPPSWVSEQRFEHHEVLPVEELPDEIHPEDRSIAFTTSEVVYAMLQDAAEQTEYDTLS